MPDLASDIRDYFDAIVDPAGMDVVPLDEPNASRHRHWFVLAAAVMVLVASAVAVASLNDDAGHEIDVVDEPVTATTGEVTTDPFGSTLGPGWHEIDTGPVPATEAPTLAWTGDELFVGAGAALVYSLDSSTGGWTELPPLPSAMGSASRPPALVATGSGVLAVEDTFDHASSALWDADASRWIDLGEIEVADNLGTVRTGMRARGSWGGGPALVWTGDAVLDLYHGAVWSPDELTWGPLAGPADLTGFTGLIYTNPVWDGHEVIAASWSTTGGLAWNSSGTEYRPIPGLPSDIADPDHGNDTLATASEGRVLLVSGSDGVPTAWFDSRTDTWTEESPVRIGPTGEGCPSQLVTTDAGPVVEPCPRERAFVVTDGTWQGIQGRPDVGASTWLEVDGNLLVWGVATGDDGVVTPRASFWVPTDDAGSDGAGNDASGVDPGSTVLEARFVGVVRAYG